MFRKWYDFLASLNLGFWLMGGVMLFMAIGSFLTGEASGINDIALLSWLMAVPVAISWWLWVAIALLALLVINTILCSIDALRLRFGRTKLLHLLAPQIMHLGFLLVVFAHLLSAQGGAKQAGQALEGSIIPLPDGSTLQVDTITGQTGPYGMATDYQATLTHLSPAGPRKVVISPNHPFFHQGTGVYLKHAEFQPSPIGVIELHREPGAAAAGAGVLLFTVGNLALLFLRRGNPT